MQYKRKRSLTKEQIQQAFLSLMKSTPFEKITIDQVSQSARITRSTFYRYYEDKYQLLAEIEDDVISNLIHSTFMKDSTPADTGELVRRILKEYQQQFPKLHILLGTTSNLDFEQKLEQQMNHFYYQSTPPKNIEEKIIQLSLTAMWLRSLKFWVLNSDTVSFQTIEKVTLKMLTIASGELNL